MKHSSLLSSYSCCISVTVIKYPGKRQFRPGRVYWGYISRLQPIILGEINIGIQCIMSRVKKGKKTKTNNNKRMDPCLLLLSLLFDRPGTGL